MTGMVAYIDPGAGTILLQMFIGSLVGVVVFFRQSIARLLGCGRRDDAGKEATADATSRK
jgi:hypothetical protein